MDCKSLGNLARECEPTLVVDIEGLEARGAAAPRHESAAVDAKFFEESFRFQSGDEMHRRFPLGATYANLVHARQSVHHDHAIRSWLARPNANMISAAVR